MIETGPRNSRTLRITNPNPVIVEPQDHMIVRIFPTRVNKTANSQVHFTVVVESKVFVVIGSEMARSFP